MEADHKENERSHHHDYPASMEPLLMEADHFLAAHRLAAAAAASMEPLLMEADHRRAKVRYWIAAQVPQWSRSSWKRITARQKRAA